VSTPNKAAESGSIEKCIITSNYGGNKLDISVGIIELHYFESLLDDTIRVSTKVVDTGFRKPAKKPLEAATENDQKGETTSIQGGEKVELSFSDNQDSKLSFPELRVQVTRDISDSTKFSSFTLDFFSSESIFNEYVDSRVYEHFEGKISDSIEKIIKENLKSKNEISKDPTLNELTFNGNTKKPFYQLNTLATQSVPDGVPNALGNTAGYFFWESATESGNGKRYCFKSIDKLLSREPKRTLIYTDTPGGTILDYSFSSTTDVKEKLVNGAFSSSKIITSNPYDQKYTENSSSSSKQEKNSILAGQEHPKIATDLDLPNKPTVISHQNLDTGTLPPGTNLKEQQKRGKEVNFDTDKIMRQSRQRYNQLFTFKLTITIVGDFSLRAGDMIFVKFPEVNWETNGTISKSKSGLYIIVDLCHLLTTDSTYTKLNLVRESVFAK
jgi:hypothetical protein